MKVSEHYRLNLPEGTQIFKAVVYIVFSITFSFLKFKL